MPGLLQAKLSGESHLLVSFCFHLQSLGLGVGTPIPVAFFECCKISYHQYSSMCSIQNFSHDCKKRKIATASKGMKYWKAVIQGPPLSDVEA